MKIGRETALIISSIHWTNARTTDEISRNCTMRKSIDDLAIETILGEYGDIDDQKRLLKDDFEDVQFRVEQYYNIAEQCTKGIWGNGWNRKTALEGAGYNAAIVQRILDKIIGERVDYNGC